VAGTREACLAANASRCKSFGFPCWYGSSCFSTSSPISATYIIMMLMLMLM
jgi:hypothetical protein